MTNANSDPKKVRPPNGADIISFDSHDYTTETTETQGFVTSFLSKGAENAMSTKDLLQLTGLPNARVLRQHIQHERGAGQVLLSSTNGGYYLPDDGTKGQQEIADCYRSMRSRAINTLRSAIVLRKAMESVEGQTTVDEVVG